MNTPKEDDSLSWGAFAALGLLTLAAFWAMSKFVKPDPANVRPEPPKEQEATR
jgi:hypothetical protein